MNDVIIGTGGEIPEELTQDMLALADEFLAANNDPRQLVIERSTIERARLLHPATVVYRAEDGVLVSWVLCIPTQRALMHRFLHDEISERELCELTIPATTYDALYLCSAFTVAIHRRKGYVLGLFAEALRRLPLTVDAPLFGWPISVEGKMIAEKVHRLFARPLFIKE